VIQQQLQAIGLNATLKPASATDLFSQWYGRQADAELFVIGARVDPGSTLFNNYLAGQASLNLGTPDPQLTSMANAAWVLPNGSKERAKAYQDIAKFLSQNPIHIPLLQQVVTYAVSDKMVGAQNLMGSAGTYSFRNMGLAKG